MPQSSRVNLLKRDDILSLRARSVSREGLELEFLLSMEKNQNTEAVVQYLKDHNLWTLALEWEDWSYLLGERETIMADINITSSESEAFIITVDDEQPYQANILKDDTVYKIFEMLDWPESITINPGNWKTTYVHLPHEPKTFSVTLNEEIEAETEEDAIEAFKNHAQSAPRMAFEIEEKS